VADGPRLGLFFVCSSCSCSFLFLSILFSCFGWTRFRTVRGRGADSPWAGEQSATTRPTVRFSGVATGGSVGLFRQSAAQAGQSAIRVQTVRRAWPDSPRGPCGQSAPPGRIVRQCVAALFLGSIPPSFLSCFRVCFKESFLRLEVDP
jgi:hypothetical protein